MPEYPHNQQGVPSSNTDHGALISFLHQAIEWENLNYFLYPYFWAPRSDWEHRLKIRHADPIHEAFLRAGAARVVVTIRRGWEKAFLALANGADYTKPPADAPYMSIAEQTELFESQTYPGIQPANSSDIDPQASTEASEGVLIGSWYEFTATQAIDIRIGQTGPTEGVFMPTTYNPAAHATGT